MANGRVRGSNIKHTKNPGAKLDCGSVKLPSKGCNQEGKRNHVFPRQYNRLDTASKMHRSHFNMIFIFDDGLENEYDDYKILSLEISFNFANLIVFCLFTQYVLKTAEDLKRREIRVFRREFKN